MRIHRWSLGFAAVAAAGLLLASAPAEAAGQVATSSQASTAGGNHAAAKNSQTWAAQGQGKAMRSAMRMNAQMRLREPAMLVYMLPTMQSELALSPSESSRLTAIKAKFASQEEANARKIIERREALDKLYASPTSDEAKVKSLLDDIAGLESQRQLEAYRTSEEMKAVLSAAQRSQLQAMSPEQMRNAVSRMTVGEIGQLMRFTVGSMGMSGGMMRGAMMRGAMMTANMAPGGAMASGAMNGHGSQSGMMGRQSQNKPKQ